MVSNLTKNGFAILRFNAWFALAAICGILLVNVGPFVGVCIAPGWSRAGYVVALASILLIYVGMSWHSDVSPWYVVLHPIGATLFAFAIARSAALTLAHRGVMWRDTLYPLAELRSFSREQRRWTWL
jgi:hypothetical protein